MKYVFPILLFLLAGQINAQESSLSGKVTSNGEPVPFANIYLEELNIGTTSNANGEYVIKNIPVGNQHVVVSAVGFKKLERQITFNGQQLQEKFSLEIATTKLNEILIVDKQTGLTRRTPYNIATIKMNGIEDKGNPGGIMGILKEVPGVYGAEFGHGIVKPFIRGLGFSRIVSIYQGNKLENHQWGADHGLGINDLGIKKVDLIKGPASVLYGSGALGGILLAKDDDSYLKSNKITGNIGSTYNSTSNGFRAYSSVGKTFNSDVYFATDLASESHADYIDGNNRTIGNSRFSIKTLRLHTGIEKSNFQNKLSFTYNQQDLGIISDEEMNDAETLATTRNDRKKQLPFQEVEDMLISYNQSTKNDKFETALHLSHHLNDRKEVESDAGLVDMGLQQDHTFYNARVSFLNHKIKHSMGLQGSILMNENLKEAEDFLVPDAQMLETGIYYMGNVEIGANFFQAALRFDHRKITADASSENLKSYGFILPGNPENRKLTRYFSGFTGSLGLTRKLDQNSNLKLNFSTGFRAPDLAELFSNGPHPGTSRFEMGNDDFEREQSLQIDAGYSYRKKRFQSNFSVFGSLIDNYIFFAATGEKREEDDLEIWEYQQTATVFYGVEFELKHTWLPEKRLETKFTGAVVRGTNRETKENLTFIPPDNYNLEIGYFGLSNRSLKLFSRLKLINNQYRVGLNEKRTPGYTLLNIGASKDFNFGRDSLNAGLTIYNVLDKVYVDHLSILRAFDVSSPGRNIMLNLKYNF